MRYKIRSLFKKFLWCIPVFIMTIGSIYFINLFNRLYTRDLIRQSNEKYQLVNFVEHLQTKDNTLLALNTIDAFLDTHTYILTKDKIRLFENSFFVPSRAAEWRSICGLQIIGRIIR